MSKNRPSVHAVLCPDCKDANPPRSTEITRFRTKNIKAYIIEAVCPLCHHGIRCQYGALTAPATTKPMTRANDPRTSLDKPPMFTPDAEDQCRATPKATPDPPTDKISLKCDTSPTGAPQSDPIQATLQGTIADPKGEMIASLKALIAGKESEPDLSEADRHLLAQAKAQLEIVQTMM
jgi:hypothetical protein